MSLLVAIEGRWPAQEMGAATKYGSDTWNAGGGRLELEMALDEFAEFFAVFVAHVHEFDAATVRPDVADDGGEIDLAETGADLQLDGVANAELPRRFQISAAKADGLYARKACRGAFDMSAKRRFQRHSYVPPRHHVAPARLPGGFVGCATAR